MSTAPLVIESDTLDAAMRRRIGRVFDEGGLVVFPTETVYGVGASVLSERGLQRLRRLKGRDGGKPLTVHMPCPKAIERYVDLSTQSVLARLAPRTMPGPITFIVEVDPATIARKTAAMGLPAGASDRLYHAGTIGLRCPDHPVAAAVLASTDAPVVASSANEAGETPPTSADGVAPAFAEKVDLVLDAGASRFARASTIVRVSGERFEVIREGVYDRRYLEKLMRRSILFVCSGNTCRSPMAERIARAELAARLGVEPDRIEDHGWGVSSAGAYATPGSPMTSEAADALRAMGIDPGRHRAKPLSAELLASADAVFTMTDSHADAVAALLPSAAGRTRPLDPAGPVDDPIGADASVYLQCARNLRRLIQQRLDELGVTHR